MRRQYFLSPSWIIRKRPTAACRHRHLINESWSFIQDLGCTPTLTKFGLNGRHLATTIMTFNVTFELRR